jgi:hypothetical protein
MDASDIRDLEAHGVLDHGYLPTPSTQRQAPNELLNLDGLTPELRDLVNQTSMLGYAKLINMHNNAYKL